MALFGAALIWGLAFVAQRVSLDNLGAFTFNGLRFALGALSLVPLTFFEPVRRKPGSLPVRREYSVLPFLLKQMPELFF